jgi:hypothetical protein
MRIALPAPTGFASCLKAAGLAIPHRHAESAKAFVHPAGGLALVH